MIKSLRNKYYNRAVPFSIGVFLICVLLFWGYLYHFYTSMTQIVVDTSQCSCEVGGVVLSERFEGYRDLVEQGASRIESLNFYNNERISDILVKYEQLEKMDQMYYFGANGELIMSSGQKTRMVYMEDLVPVSELDLSNGAVLTVLFNSNQQSNGIAVVAPVYKENEIRGYLVGTCSSEEKRMVPVKDYYHVHPVFYVVRNSDGVIVTKYTSLGEESEELQDATSLNLALNSMENITSTNQEEIETFLDTMGEGGIGNIRLPFKNGKVRLFTAPIGTQTNWSMVTVMPESMITGIAGAHLGAGIVTCVLVLILVLILVVYISATAIKSEKKMESIAYFDDITCARNMNYFKKRAAELLEHEKNIPYVVARFDISGFRFINEAFGHERGDEILRTIALYGEETFGSKEIFARNTADQFVALMVDLEDITLRMDNFSARINEYARSIDVSFPIILRTGYYRVRKNDKNIADMIDKANVARKTIERDSKNFTVAYGEDMQKMIRMREEIESSMEQALVHNEFKVYLQPKFDIIENKVAGAEALVRWIKKDGTMVYPDQFIPVFEQNGFIERLDFFMLEEICRHISKMMKAGQRTIPVSVNQSRVLLMNPDYVHKVQKILKKFEIPKDVIELELTETVFFDEKEKMIAVMNELKESNIVWDIDDFGSGFSSLNLLKEVPFDCLKIDRDFFGETADSETSKLILRKIVEMAEGLHVQCICEGVETEAQAELLRSIGCRYAQGFLYSKPIPLEEFIEKYVTC